MIGLHVIALHSDGRNNVSEEKQRPTERKRVISINLDNFEDVDKAVRDAVNKGKDVAFNVGDTIKDKIKSVRTGRDSVVMVRVNKEILEKLDELVDSGVNSSRSEAAAFMIAEGMRAKTDLFDKIAEKTEVIRNAREELRKLLEETDEVDQEQEQPGTA
jgi:Arc/MetJ-type ribon-helix-helix transcriptional regulator